MEPTFSGASYVAFCLGQGWGLRRGGSKKRAAAFNWAKTRGIQWKPSPRRIGSWNLEEESLLKELWGLQGPKEIAKKMGRTWRQVSQMAYRLNLKSKPILCLKCWKPFVPSMVGHQIVCSKKCRRGLNYTKRLGKTGRAELNNYFRTMEKKRAEVLPEKLKRWTPEKAARIVEEYRRGRLSLKSLAQKYGVGQNTMRKALCLLAPAAYADAAEAKRDRGTAYSRGRNFEYRVRDHLKGFGFMVQRSPMSAGTHDLTAIRKGEVLLVQCKTNGAIGQEEREALVTLSESIGAVPLVAWRGHGEKGLPILLADLRNFSGPMRTKNNGRLYVPVMK